MERWKDGFRWRKHKHKYRYVRTFVREFGDGALDGEGVARLEPLVHVLANQAILVLFDEQHEFALMIRARNGRVRAHGRFPLFVQGRVLTVLGGAHDDKRGDGRERRALVVGQLKGEARGVVVVGFDGFELEVEETLGV